MIGKTLNHFKVLDRLGKGGMGEVYVAEDSKLKRKIALKVLPEEVARDPARLDRFQREAESIAALNHPNIVTIYSIEEADGIRFLTMELVEGETLNQLIPNKGMDVEEFLRLSTPVAEALSAAHEKGIIHRDLKPANIMASREGRIKVLDFGLAKLQRDSDPDSSRMETHAQTEDGIVLGTMPYMSPEQIQGKKLDQRSDIFSLGIIFYEMITGHRPFQGDTSADLISSILRDTPDPISDLKAGMPEHLERIVRRCLMKDPRDRYQTARDVFNELRDLKTTSGPSTRHRAAAPVSGEMWIAVLPFQHPAADPEMETFTDGLVQDITGALSQFSYLSVNAGATRDQIGARYVIQGGIRKSGSLIRVNLQLMDTRSGTNLWAETYNRDLKNSDIFTIQDEITDRVAATLADNFGVLVRSMIASLEDKPEDQLSANEFVFRFFGYWAKLTPAEHAKIRTTLEKAVQKFPKNAELWGYLSIVYANENYLRLNELPNSLDRCLMAAQRAVELNRASQIAHEALAWAHFLRRDLAAMPAAIDRAISLNPRNSNTLATLGGLLVHIREFERGAEMTHRAIELNPHHAGWYYFPLIWDHCSRGEWEQMLEKAKRINMPGVLWVPLVIASACGHLNRKSEAAAALTELLSIDPEFGAHAREYLGPLLSASGLIDSLIQGLQKAGLQTSNTESQPKSITATDARDLIPTSESFTPPASAEMWIAVLPFQHPAADPEIETFSDGLTQDITAALSQFSYLSVSAAREQLGARYVIQGGIRKSGSLIRVNVQLIDGGTNLWAETYNRDLKSSDIFTIQDEITDRVAATLADQFGVLVRSMVASLEDKPDEQLSGNEFVFRFFGYWAKLTPEEHAKIRTTLERAVERIPRNAEIWGCLSLVYYHEFAFGFNELPNSLDRCLMAAQRAVEINRTSQLAYEALTWAQFFRRDVAALPATVERAISLNPRNSHMLAVAGLVLVHTRNFDRGATVARRAMELNPHHAGWYHFSLIWDHYSRGEYDQALEQAKQVNMPGFFWPPLVIASICGELDRKAEAASAVNELLAIDPEFAVHARRYIEPWHYTSGFLEPLLEGLRKAGLTEQSIASRMDHTSGQRRADEGFWIAVLPFKCAGGKAELTTFADGMAEQIVTGLSRFSYLRVIARSSTLRYAETSVDARTAGKEIGARYIMEGSLRQGGSVLRVSVQLVDASTGTHLWAETYDRTFSADNIFALQDDLVPRIVSTIADIHGILPRSMGEAVHNLRPDQMSPYEAVLCSFVYFERAGAEEHAVAHSALELAVKKAPDYADAWAMLALVRAQDYGQGFQLLNDPLKEAATAARRAIEAGPANHMAHFSLAEVLFFQKQFQSFRNSAERAAALNPMDAVSLALLGELLTYAGDFDRGLALAARAKQLNPNHPGWYWYVDFFNAYRKGDYRDALGYLLKANMPGHWGYNAALAATYAQLGEHIAAAKALQELLNIRPDFAATARSEAGKWWDAEYVEHFIDGLRKAGLFAKSDPTVTTEPRNSIAVLPFTNLSADPENEFFCDGLAEEMLNALAKIDQLKVAARTSTFSFKGKNVPVSEVAKALNVNTILEGSVRKSGNRVRITAQLINAADGYHLWSERYDIEMKDIFDIQDEITLAVVKALKVKLLGQEQAALLKRHTSNPEAHEFYLRGLAYFIRWTPEFFQKAIENFDQAIAIDPRYAAAYAGLAEAYTEMSFVSSPRESMPRAREAARKALDVDDSLGNAHNSLAVIKMYYDQDYAGAEQEFKLAIALDPGSAHIHMWYGWYLGLMGRFDEALKEQRCAQELDPLSDMLDFGIGAIFHWSHQPDRAIEQLRRVLELNPNRSIAYWFLAEAYVQKGDFASAIATIENAPIALNDPITLPAVAYVYAKAGERHKALEILSDLQKRSSQEYEPAFHIAQIYLGLGDNEQAFAWLNKACDERSVWLIWLNVDPKFDPLRSDPRFEELLRKIRFAN